MKRTIVLIAISLIALACARKEAPPVQAKTPLPLPADVAKVSAAVTTATDTTSAPSGIAGESGGTIVATGEFVSPVRSELAAKLPGRVGKMYVDEGSLVSKGQPLLELETDYTRINLQRAEADAQRAAAAEADAERDLSRKKELIAKDSIPRATYDRSASAFDQAKAAHASAVAQANMFRQQLNDSVLRSPLTGVVAEKRTDIGQRLGDNTVALVVVQTSPLKLRFRVPEKYLAEVHRGEDVKATVDPYPGQVFAGKVTVVGGVIDPATRSFTVETEFANRDGKLRPGLFARIEMEPR